MFAVMKHWDIMLGVDLHQCWPPESPAPIGPKPYFVCMLMMGTMVTAELSFTAFTFNGWTMKRGTDIGPLIPHIGIPSLLTPLDIAFSSSASYFGPSSCCVEGAPVAAALFMFANPNLNCNEKCPAPTGLVLCFTTHYVGMTLLDVLFGFITMGIAVVMEVAISGLAGVAGEAAQKAVIKPVCNRVAAKLASRRAARAATGRAARAATPSAPASPGVAPWRSARPSPPGGPHAGGHQPDVRPTGPPIGGHRQTGKGRRGRTSKKQFALDLSLDIFAELSLSVPGAVVNEVMFEVLATSGVEEFGASQSEGASQET